MATPEASVGARADDSDGDDDVTGRREVPTAATAHARPCPLRTRRQLRPRSQSQVSSDEDDEVDEEEEEEEEEDVYELPRSCTCRAWDCAA